MSETVLSPALLWWLVAGLLVAAEVASGTFYLLMLAPGAAAGAAMAHAGFGFSAQLVAAALVGGGAVTLWHFRRLATARRSPPPAANPDVNLDVGSEVQVARWNADGTARVHYRGAFWDARWGGSGAPAAGAHVIRAVEASRLVLDRPQH